MATAPDLSEPHIAAARAQAWHQAGEPLLTLEAARSWLGEYGLVLFAARPALGAPAPSLVEATLGMSKDSTSVAEAAVARTLLARLVGEGSAVPLNLLGGPGDLPDFLVSAAAFPFIFTLRGDKGWKRPPETTGVVKVSPLALRIYELLAERGALPVAEIVSEIGREVNESAASRALSELWQSLRVLPVPQQGEGATRWELATARFLKGVKAGANAGQPTALSALISLFLRQSVVATEEEIASFLSPLTARSRVRDVLHGLSASRQLAEAVLHGKAVLFLPDALPDFTRFAAQAPVPEPAEAEAAAHATPAAEASSPDEGRPRIRRFGGEDGVPKDRSLRGRPVRAAAAARTPADRSRRPFTPDRGAGGAGRPQREGRPFSARPPRADRGDAAPGPARPPRGDRPSFSRPPDEDRAGRPPRRDAGEQRTRPFAPRADGPSRPPRGDRAGSGDRSFGARPPRDRPFRDRGDGRPARSSGSEERPAFRGPKTWSKSSDRPGASRRPFGAAASEGGFGERGGERRPSPRGDRPPRPFRPRTDEAGPLKRPFRPRADAAGSGERPFRPRADAAGSGDRPFRPRADGAGSGDRPFRPRAEGAQRDRGDRGAPERPFRPRSAAGGRESGSEARPRAGAAPFRGRPARAGAGEGSFGERGGERRPPSRGDRPFRPARSGSPRQEEGRAAGSGFGRKTEDRPPGRGPAGAGRATGPPKGFRARPGAPRGARSSGGDSGTDRAPRASRPPRPRRPPVPGRPEDEA